jgi:hypothetical protein
MLPAAVSLLPFRMDCSWSGAKPFRLVLVLIA